MWIKKLRLNNFQKHADLTLDFTPGVNVIYGQSDAGKSCIRRAFGFVFFGDPRTDEIIRKEETKTTSVSVTLDDDTEVERTKSTSVNRYTVRHPGRKDIVYDSIGAEIPQEVQQVLMMNLVEIDKYSLNLNIAEQVCLPFLTGAEFPASARLKLFNKLTGNDLLDLIVQNINKEIMGIRRDLKTEQGVIAVNEPKITELDGTIKTKKTTIDMVTEKLKKMGDRYQNFKFLSDLSLNLTSARKTLADLKTQKDGVKLIDETRLAAFKVRIDRFEALCTLKDALHTLRNRLYMLKNSRASIKVADIDISKYQERIQKLNDLKLIAKGLTDSRNKLKKLHEDKKLAETQHLQAEQEYRSILKEAGVCPTCQTVMTEEHISNVNLNG